MSNYCQLLAYLFVIQQRCLHNNQTISIRSLLFCEGVSYTVFIHEPEQYCTPVKEFTWEQLQWTSRELMHTYRGNIILMLMILDCRINIPGSIWTEHVCMDLSNVLLRICLQSRGGGHAISCSFTLLRLKYS